jgi:membrane-associated phospholipid phosphatase
VVDQTTPDSQAAAPAPSAMSPATTAAGSVSAEPVTVATDPAVAQTSAVGWRIWLVDLLRHGRSRLAALGLTLGLGLVAALLALYLFAVLADEVMAKETIQVDTAVLLALRSVQSPALDRAAWVASALGAEWLAVLMVVLLGVLGWQRRWGAAVGLLLTVVGAQLLNDVLKDWFQRTRPAPVDSLIPAQAFSFPSGHAMVAAAFYLYIGYLAWRLLTGRWRFICAALLVLVAFLIGLSRLYLGVHYLTDVIAGYIAGIAWTDAIIIGGSLLGRRRKTRTPGMPTTGPLHPRGLSPDREGGAPSLPPGELLTEPRAYPAEQRAPAPAGPPRSAAPAASGSPRSSAPAQTATPSSSAPAASSADRRSGTP